MHANSKIDENEVRDIIESIRDYLLMLVEKHESSLIHKN